MLEKIRDFFFIHTCYYCEKPVKRGIRYERAYFHPQCRDEYLEDLWSS